MADIVTLILADHARIRRLFAGLEAARDCALHQAGSHLWWLAVRAARAAADQHIDAAESGLLPGFREQLPDQTRHALGQQWIQLMTALSRDGQTELPVR